jgi:IS30 family transposase
MLRDTVCRLLREDWSPEQISGWLRESQLAREPKMYVSCKTIRKSLFIQANGVFREELKQHLRTKVTFRYVRVYRVSSRAQIADAISFRERPSEIEDRAALGYW